MGMRASFRAGPLLAACALLLAGCSVPAGTPPPVYALFAEEQGEADRLPEGSTALWSVLPATTRFVGEVDGYEFFVGLSVNNPFNPYCVVVANEMGDAVHCGGESFSGEYSPGLGFSFDAHLMWVLSTGEMSWWQLGPHLAVELAASIPAAIIEIQLFENEQQEHDLIPGGAMPQDRLDPDTSRLYGEHDGYRYFVARPIDKRALICVLVFTVEGGGGMGACGDSSFSMEDTSSSSPTFHFSYSGHIPVGEQWIALGPHLAVWDTSGEE